MLFRSPRNPIEVVESIADGNASVARIMMVDVKFGNMYRINMLKSLSPYILAASIYDNSLRDCTFALIILVNCAQLTTATAMATFIALEPSIKTIAIANIIGGIAQAESVMKVIILSRCV